MEGLCPSCTRFGYTRTAARRCSATRRRPIRSRGDGEVLVELRAASLNHLDVLSARAAVGPEAAHPRRRRRGRSAWDTGERVVINPGLEHGGRPHQRRRRAQDGTHAELVAVPEENVYPLPDALSFEEAAAFPLVFETAYRMLVTRAAAARGEWVLVWGIGGGVATAALAIAKALGARVLATSSSDEKLARARSSAPTRSSTTRPATSARPRRRRPAARRDVVVEHVGEATWATSLAVARPGRPDRGLRRDHRPEPAGEPAPHLVEAADVYGSTMGTREDFEGAYELVASGRARPVLDAVFPLAETRAAHERLEARRADGQDRPEDPGAGNASSRSRG